MKYKIITFEYETPENNQLVRINRALLGDEQIPMTVDEVISYLESTDADVVFIQDLEGLYGLFEPYMTSHKWQLKICDGDNYHPYTVLKNIKQSDVILYTVSMFGKARKCNNITVRQLTNHVVKIYDYTKWSNFTEVEINELQPQKSTPAANGRKETFGENREKTKWSLKNKTEYALLQQGREGGFIFTDCAGQFFSTAYHYDITSLYPWCVVGIDYWPNPATIKYTTKKEKADHTRYAYWTYRLDGSYQCEVEAEEIPEGSIKMRLNIQNAMKDTMVALTDKKNAAERGSTNYKYYKLVVNSIIGSFIQRARSDHFYPHYYDDEGIKARAIKGGFNFIERYTYVIALARKRIFMELRAAEAQGAKILQVNTDGFFTDKPVEYDKIRTLGSLRYEYQAHNLKIFSCNQYACDEEICLAGIDKKLYKENQRIYSIFEIKRSERGPIWYEQKTTLGEIENE